MNRSKFLAALMAVIMVISMLPAMVFAEGGTALDGKLKIRGQIVLGNELSADYESVTPGGVTDDDVSFSWSRLISEDQEPVLISTERTYRVSEEDLGYKIILTVAGLAERGYSGSLKATSRYGAVATAEEAAEAEAALADPGEDIPAAEDLTEENQAEETPAEETPAEVTQEDTYGEDLYIEDEPSEDMTAEDISDYDEYDGYDGYDEIESDPDDELFEENNVQEESFAVSEDGSVGTYASRNANDPYTYEAAAIADNTAEDGTTPTVDFGTFIEGTEDSVESKYITIKNTGTGTLNFTGISPEHFEVGDVTEPLAAGGEVSLYIRPRSGVEAGTYTNEEIVYTAEEGASVTILASMTVEEADVDSAASEAEDPGSDPGVPMVIDDGEPQADDTKSIIAVDGSGDEISGYSFGEAETGYTQPVAVGISLKNIGSTGVTLAPPVSGLDEENSVFIVDGYTGITDNVLPAGDTAVFSIQPKSGLDVGEYSETLSIYEADPENSDPLLTFAVSFSVTKGDFDAVTLLPESGTLDFGTVKQGYSEAPAAQEITITNAGTGVLTLTQPAAENYELGDLSAYTLASGDSAVLSVRPKTGLLENAYSEYIRIENDAELALGFTAMLSVTAPDPTPTPTPEPTATPVPVHKIVSIQNPGDITGVANASEKSVKGLGLPAAVAITTNLGETTADVVWDVENCGYDPGSVESQIFQVSGQVILPDGVQNPDGVSLTVSVNVSVNAYSPKLASADNNRITGISSDTAYDTLSKISFTAVGAGMDNTSPRKGDTRYVPLYWKVINTNSFSGSDYSATFGMAQQGQYTLSVVFDQQLYDGSKWANTGKQDTKTVVFHVIAVTVTAVPGQTLTPAAAGKNAVKTGDTTPILPFIVILAVAIVAAAGAGVVIFRRKKK